VDNLPGKEPGQVGGGEEAELAGHTAPAAPPVLVLVLHDGHRAASGKSEVIWPPWLEVVESNIQIGRKTPVRLV